MERAKRVSIMVNVEKALSPLFLIAFIFGLGIFRYPLNRPKYYLSILYILTVWSVYAYTFYYATILFSLKGVFQNFLVFFIVMINLFVTMITIITTIYKHKKFWQSIRKLSLVDDTLEKLNVPKEYRGMRKLIKQILITWFLITSFSCSLDCLLDVSTHNDMKAILIPYVLNYSIYVNTIIDIMFMFLLRYIGIRLDKINDHIKQLLETKDCGLKCKWKKSLVVNNYYMRNTENHKHMLWTIMHLHSEICRIARDVNNFFGVQMTLQMLSYFIILIGMMHFHYDIILHFKEIYGNYTIQKLILSNNLWFLVFLIKFISLNHMCESVSAKAQKIKDVIHKLTNLTCYAEIREEIFQFILQISLQPLKFNGMGLFYFGYDFIRKYFMWILIVVIFMAQMDFGSIWPDLYIRTNVSY